MFDSKAVEVATFPPCGDGLKALRPFRSGELIGEGKFDVCALNDGKALEIHCSFCLEKFPKIKCSKCSMTHYCSSTCQKKDEKLHEMECTLASRLKPIEKVPMRSQRLLLRFLQSGHDADINYNAEAIGKSVSEYLMTSCAIIKKYLPELEGIAVHKLLSMSCQLRCSCFEIGVIGVGYSDALKKINHSCEPNTIAEFSGNSVGIIAVKDIQPGEQITVSYIDDPKSDPNILSNFFHFKCQCDYCTK